MVEKLSITLPTDMVDAIKARVKSGQYASTSEVLREAMRGWMRREEEQEARLAAVRARIEAVAQDRLPSVPIGEAFDRIRAQINGKLVFRV